jgi:hypothetical protein
MKKIISIIRPFCVNQECYLYENGVKIKNFTIPLSDFKKTIMNYVEKESVTKFLENRQNLESVTLEVKRDGTMYNRLTLLMREGVKFNIQKANDQTLLKLDKAFEFYKNLTMPNGNKGEGEYFVYVMESSKEIVVTKS